MPHDAAHAAETDPAFVPRLVPSFLCPPLGWPENRKRSPLPWRKGSRLKSLESMNHFTVTHSPDASATPWAGHTGFGPRQTAAAKATVAAP